ncbi:MAG: hypothetical protein HYZ37_10120 [Candidatus Solibacter usitatus]|nr:hypothetical protein [Candidatus Solibacter usitatus]
MGANESYAERLVKSLIGGGRPSPLATGVEWLQPFGQTPVLSSVAGLAGSANPLDGLAGGAIGLLASLLSFLGDSGAAAPEPLRYSSPPAMRFDYGFREENGGYGGVDSNQLGRRRFDESAQPQQVVVQVQAMDSRSFLDHSNEIAEAVRKALLNSHPLQDVLREA